MPHPGLKVATNPEFDGKLSGMHQPFKLFVFKTPLLHGITISLQNGLNFSTYLSGSIY
jgi:hypothetical protein